MLSAAGHWHKKRPPSRQGRLAPRSQTKKRRTIRLRRSFSTSGRIRQGEVPRTRTRGQIKQSGPPATHRSVSDRTNFDGPEQERGERDGSYRPDGRQRHARDVGPDDDDDRLSRSAARRHARLDIRTGTVKSARRRRCDLDGFDRFQESALRGCHAERTTAILVGRRDLLRAVVRVNRRGTVWSEMRAEPFDKSTPGTVGGSPSL
ncbi:hypothetical protein HPB50_005066 [Hyalomma asiaticum]|uniref:Uncharacterized protein n=1 Tax=Hyalomma asiaticum TaxID=266040 RepID=A0ACB7SNG2_HYAAI|nr:hypothetical protein HPB50_005066 [Hyalomma asiaticum]